MPGTIQEHEFWMQRALQLAKRGEGKTRPNPPVGAVLVKGGSEIGAGYHHEAGKPHAEIEALKGLSLAQTAGATLYVTLEPCSTHGRTPPCTEAIVAAGIQQLVVSVQDPNPKHAGRGVRKLRSKGLKVKTGVCREAGAALLAPFSKWVTQALPYVTLKMAMTLDGRIGDKTGMSRWITRAAARKEVQQLRRRVDAVLVGGGTAAADDPSLLVKTAVRNQPLRVILDGKSRIPNDAKVLCDAYPSVVVVTESCSTYRRKQLESDYVEVWTCGCGDRVDLHSLLQRLASENIMHVLCEGGGELAGALLREGLVDQCVFYIAGRILGGDGVPVTGTSGWLLENAPYFRMHDVRKVGHDVCITAIPMER